MKRPLCLISIVITVMVFFYLEIFLSDYVTDYSDHNEEPARIVGIVDRKELRTDYLGNRVPVIYIIPTSTSLGKNKYIQCYMSLEETLEPSVGEYVKVSGIIQSFSSPRNPGEFDSSLYYATLKISYRIKNARIIAVGGKKNVFYEKLYRCRMYFENILDKNLAESDAAIMKAVLLGNKNSMDDKTKELYKNAGIIHILAVSGLHISIIGMGIYKALRKCRLRPAYAAIFPILFMYVYGQMCGMSSSAARAIAMFAIRLLAPLVGRTYDMLTSLAVVEIMLLFDQPLYLYNSGFLFSFGAIVGIAYIRPSLEKRLKCPDDRKMHFVDDKTDGPLQKITGHVKNGLLAGTSVLLATLPVYAEFYYTYPIWSLLLNLLVLPLMAPLMILGIICLFSGSILSGQILISVKIIHLILQFYSIICSLTYKLPFRNLYLGHTTKMQIIAYYILLFVVVEERVMEKVILLVRKGYERGKKVVSNKYRISHEGEIKKKLKREDELHEYRISHEVEIKKKPEREVELQKYRISITASIALSCLAVFILLFRLPAELQITMIDVGQGDGILIRSGNEKILIDGGSTNKKNVGKYSIIPYLQYEGIGKLDAVVVTHEDEDHISGIFEIMEDMEKGGIKIGNLVLPDASENSRGDNYRKLEEKARSLEIPTSYISCGQRLKFKRIEFVCLNPERSMITEGANAYSTVLFMKHGGFTALFTGDVEEEGQQHLLQDIKSNPEIFKNLTFLKVAHHGSKYTTDEEFLRCLNPRLAIISCGVSNRYGHPHNELIERLESIDSAIYRTDESGAITVKVDGNKVSVDEYLK